MNEPQYNEHDPKFQQWLKRNDPEPTAPVEIEPRCLFSDGLDEPCPICAAPVSWVGDGYFVACPKDTEKPVCGDCVDKYAPNFAALREAEKCSWGRNAPSFVCARRWRV